MIANQSADDVGIFQRIPASRLAILWPTAQRPPREHEVKKIVKEYDPDSIGCIIVSGEINGFYHIIDGQARTETLRLLFGMDALVPCRVTKARTAAECAAVFRRVNGLRIKPTPMQNFTVAVTEGATAEVSVNALVTSLGLKISQQGGGEGVIRAVGALMGVYRQYGLDALRDVLLTIRATWSWDNDAYDAPVIQGYALFLAKHPEIDRNKLAKKVCKKWTAPIFVGAIRSLRQTAFIKNPEAACQLLRSEYNKGLSASKQLPQ
jgi:hypothetical protein